MRLQNLTSSSKIDYQTPQTTTSEPFRTHSLLFIWIWEQIIKTLVHKFSFFLFFSRFKGKANLITFGNIIWERNCINNHVLFNSKCLQEMHLWHFFLKKLSFHVYLFFEFQCSWKIQFEKIFIQTFIAFSVFSTMQWLEFMQYLISVFHK